MLRRLTNNQDIAALRNLVDVIEPVKEYQRNNLREHTSFSPLTRVADAARADAKIAREFRNLVTGYLADSTPDSATFETMRCWLQLWQANHGRLLPIIQNSPVLGEIETLSADLSRCAGLGLTALDFLQKQQRPPVDWLDTASATVTRAKQPRGETELMILPAIEALLKKASSL